MIKLLFLLIFCSDMFAQDWKRVYLATYPRSGNSWARLLIEDALGIATCSVYNDSDFNHPLIPNTPNNIAFPCGGYGQIHGLDNRGRIPNPGEPAVTKTHFPLLCSEFDYLPYTKVIRIIRNPVDSIYSHFRFYTKNQRIPKSKLIKLIKGWKEFHNYWEKQNNVVTFRYEDMLENCEGVLNSILKQIDYPFSENDLKRAVNDYKPVGHELKSVKFFTSQDLEIINRELGAIMAKYNYKTG